MKYNYYEVKIMEKIASFQINHNLLERGIYVSRKDYLKGEVVITTFDLRFTKPNKEEVMSTGAVHAIEHLGATFLRNDFLFKDKIIYFGPMGCRTGFYLLLYGNLNSFDIRDLLKKMLNYILEAKEIPGASPKDCGNYTDMNLREAKKYSLNFLEDVINNLNETNTIYPKL